MSQGSNQTLYGQSNPVYGQTALWGLVALALNAMTQPSLFDSMSSSDPDLFNNWTLVPHRSSPFICLTDTFIAVMWAIYFLSTRHGKGQYRRATSASTSAATSSHNSVALTMRWVIFMLGVLPQAIKIFGMRGVTLTQAIAGIFLGSSLVSAATKMYGSSEHGTGILASSEDRYTKNEVKLIMRCGMLAIVLGLVLHASVFIWIWYLIAKDVYWLGNFVVNLMQYTRGCVHGLSCVFAAQWLICWTYRWRILPRLPGVFILWSVGIDTAFSFFPSRISENTGHSLIPPPPVFLQKEVFISRALERAAVLAVAASACSFSLAYMLSRLASFVSGEVSKSSSTEDLYIETVKRTASEFRQAEEKSHAIGENLFASFVSSDLTPNGPNMRILAMIPSVFPTSVGLPIFETFWSKRVRNQFLGLIKEFHQEFSTAKWQPSNAYHQSLLAQDRIQGQPVSDNKDIVGTSQLLAVQQGRVDIEEPMILESLPAQSHASADNCNNHPIPRRSRPSLVTALFGGIGPSIDVGATKIKELPREVAWVAFSIFNLLTAALYYLLIFDGTGTTNPGWTQVFG